MMTTYEELTAWLADPSAEVVRKFRDSALPEETLTAAGGSGMTVIEVDGAAPRDIPSLHAVLALAGHFPSYYGANWDALFDFWSDPPTSRSGQLWIIHSAETLAARLPDACAVLSEIAEAADERLRATGDTFRLLLSEA